MSDDAAASASRTASTTNDELGIGTTSGKQTACMVATMLASVPTEIVLASVLGIQAGRMSSLATFVVGLAILLAFISAVMALVSLGQTLLIRRYCGVRTQPRGLRKVLPPYWQHRRQREAGADLSPLFSHAPGACLSSRQLATVIAVFPVLGVLAIAAVMAAVYALGLDYVWVIGVTAGFGGSLAFVAPVLRVLRLPRATSAELAADPSLVRLYESDRP